MDFRGNRGDTQEKPYDNERGRPVLVLSGSKLADIRKRNFAGLVRESELSIVPLASQRQHNFERGKGQYLYHISEGVKERRLRNA